MSELKRFRHHPIPMVERVSIIYVDSGALERSGHSFVASTAQGKTVIPIGRTSVLMMGLGTSVTHQAVALVAAEGALLIWSAENGVRLYASGNPRSDGSALVRQALLHANPVSRLAVAGRVFRLMFNEEPPARRSIEQLRGIEGSRVKMIYRELAAANGIEWEGRNSQSLSHPVDAALAGANAALYGLTEAVVLALGLSPAIGFVHSGNARSFVFDAADCLKFKTVVPLAFELASKRPVNMEREIRLACRDYFFQESMTSRLIDVLEELVGADALPGPS